MNIKQKLIKEFFENYIDRATGKIYLLDKAQLQPKLEQLLDDYKQQVSVEPEVKPACEQYQLLIDALVNILNEDGHQWSTRPCPTCRVITAVIGKPFGCDKRRLSKSV